MAGSLLAGKAVADIVNAADREHREAVTTNRTNLSRPEIAGELSVSLNTVGTHLRSIYAKLQVRDRSSAVRRARELRLLAARRTR
jgi:ATP/maltotriose-dependent transcriptional regulator MalT